MKKILTFCFLMITMSPVFADGIKELRENGWHYGCNSFLRGGFNFAAINGETEIMDLEVKAGLDITKCGNYMPAVLIKKNQKESLDFLFKNGYDVNGEYLGFSNLLIAIFYKRPEMVDVIIKNGADVNKLSKKYTPLNYAVKQKQPEIAKMLLNAGAKPDAKTNTLIKKTKNKEIKALFEE